MYCSRLDYKLSSFNSKSQVVILRGYSREFSGEDQDKGSKMSSEGSQPMEDDDDDIIIEENTANTLIGWPDDERIVRVPLPERPTTTTTTTTTSTTTRKPSTTTRKPNDPFRYDNPNNYFGGLANSHVRPKHVSDTIGKDNPTNMGDSSYDNFQKLEDYTQKKADKNKNVNGDEGGKVSSNRPCKRTNMHDLRALMTREPVVARIPFYHTPFIPVHVLIKFGLIPESKASLFRVLTIASPARLILTDLQDAGCNHVLIAVSSSGAVFVDVPSTSLSFRGTFWWRYANGEESRLRVAQGTNIRHPFNIHVIDEFAGWQQRQSECKKAMAASNTEDDKDMKSTDGVFVQDEPKSNTHFAKSRTQASFSLSKVDADEIDSSELRQEGQTNLSEFYGVSDDQFSIMIESKNGGDDDDDLVSDDLIPIDPNEDGQPISQGRRSLLTVGLGKGHVQKRYTSIWSILRASLKEIASSLASSVSTAEKSAEFNRPPSFPLANRGFSVQVYGRAMAIAAIKLARAWKQSTLLAIIPTSISSPFVNKLNHMIKTMNVDNLKIISSRMDPATLSRVYHTSQSFYLQLIGREIFEYLPVLDHLFPVHFGRMLSLARHTFVEMVDPNVMIACMSALSGNSTHEVQQRLHGLIKASLFAVNIHDFDVFLIPSGNKSAC